RALPPPRRLGLDRRAGHLPGRRAGGPRVLAAAGAAVAARRQSRPRRRHLRIPRARPVAAPPAGGDLLTSAAALLPGSAARALALAGLAAFLVIFDSAVLVLALPAISADFHTSTAALTGLGSALSLGTVAALPVAMQADRLGRRRLLTLAVAGFSLANLAS